MSTQLLRLSLVVSLLAACGEAPSPSAEGTPADGKLLFSRSATIDVGGFANIADATDVDTPAHPGPDASVETFDLVIEVEGNGSLSVPSPSCQLDVAGRFVGMYEGVATVDEDGFYIGGAQVDEGEFMALAGCEIPVPTVTAYTSVVVRGEIEAGVEECSLYCEARARAYAEVACEGSVDAISEADCRYARETEYGAGCNTTCTEGDSLVIVAETALSASEIGDATLSGSGGLRLGEIGADLEFDHLEDAAGNVVDDL